MNRVCLLLSGMIAHTLVGGSAVRADTSYPRNCEQWHQSDSAVLAKPLGTNPSVEQYLSYMLALTRQHLDLLPDAAVGDRRGKTVLAVEVERSGRIKTVTIVTPSAYPDVDRRVAQMVEAVPKFPPLPQWYQHDSVRLEMTLQFPLRGCNIPVADLQ